jgi:hypothetical protein
MLLSEVLTDVQYGAVLQEVSTRPVYVEWVRDDMEVLYLGQACSRQGWFNQEHAYRELGLRSVAGSLGIGLAHQVPFYEYGGAEYTTFAHYRRSRFTVDSLATPGCQVWDAHVWLEDADGRVYDVVSSGMTNCAAVRGKTLRLPERHVIEGVDKAELAAHGLHYAAAVGITQQALMTAMHRQWRPVLDQEVAAIELHGAATRARLAVVELHGAATRARLAVVEPQ